MFAAGAVLPERLVFQELLHRVRAEVGRRPSALASSDALLRVQALLNCEVAGLLVLFISYEPFLQHVFEDHVAPLFRRFGVHERVVLDGGLDSARQQCRLGHSQFVS